MVTIPHSAVRRGSQILGERRRRTRFEGISLYKCIISFVLILKNQNEDGQMCQAVNSMPSCPRHLDSLARKLGIWGSGEIIEMGINKPGDISSIENRKAGIIL